VLLGAVHSGEDAVQSSAMHSGCGDPGEAIEAGEETDSSYCERACGMKTEQSNSQIWVDGHLVEIDLDAVATEELTVTPHLLDGFHPCDACEEVLVLAEKKYCMFCQQFHDELERRFPTQKRIDLGVAPIALRFEPAEPDYDPGKPASLVGVAIVFVSALMTAMGLMTGLWYAWRAVIGFCLAHFK
jgi:hypothetical protein